MNGLNVQGGDPALGDQALLGDVQVEEVEGVVDGLDLADLHEPDLDVLGRSHQHPVSIEKERNINR